MINLNLETITSGFNLARLNTNFEKIRVGLEQAVSRSAPLENDMAIDLDMNGNEIINVKTIRADTVQLASGDLNEVLDSIGDLSSYIVRAEDAASVAEGVAGAITSEYLGSTFSTVTVPTAVTLVRMGGYYELGDWGEGVTWKRVGSEPASGIGIQDATGAWFDWAEKEIYPAGLGLKVIDIEKTYDTSIPAEVVERDADVTINDVVVVKAKAAAQTLKMGQNYDFVGKFYHSVPIEIPDVTEDGVAWDRDQPTYLVGLGRGLTISQYIGTETAVKQATYDTPDRGQPMGPVISGFTFIGPQDFTNYADCIRLSNGRSTVIRNNACYGFPKGAFIAGKPQAAGGNFGLIVDNNIVTTEEYVYDNVNNVTYYTDEIHERNCVASFLRSDASINSVGKFNDITIKNNRCLMPLISFIDGEGTGAWGTSTSTGSMANLRLENNVVFFEGCHKMQEGPISAGTTTTAQLRTDSYPTDDITGKELGMFNHETKRWEYRYIDSYVDNGSTRTVTWTDPLTFTPNLTEPVGESDPEITEYRVAYADADSRARWPTAGVAQHYIYWSSIYTGTSNDYVEDAKVPIVFDSNGNTKFMCHTNAWVVRSSNGCIDENRNPRRPAAWLGGDPTGGDNQEAHMGVGSIVMQNGDFDDVEFAITMLVKNVTGTTLNNGDVVMMRGLDRFEMTNTVDYASSTGYLRPFVVYNPNTLPWLDQAIGQVVLKGRVKVQIDGPIEDGAPIVMADNNLGQGILMRRDTDIAADHTALLAALPASPTVEELRAAIVAMSALDVEVASATQVCQAMIGHASESNNTVGKVKVTCDIG